MGLRSKLDQAHHFTQKQERKAEIVIKPNLKSFVKFADEITSKESYRVEPNRQMISFSSKIDKKELLVDDHVDEISSDESEDIDRSRPKALNLKLLRAHSNA